MYSNFVLLDWKHIFFWFVHLLLVFHKVFVAFLDLDFLDLVKKIKKKCGWQYKGLEPG